MDSKTKHIEKNEYFLRLYNRHEPAVRAFVKNGVQDYHDVAEVMQETCIVAWNKFDELDDPESAFGKWLCVIARYQIMRFRRDKARDRLLLNDNLVDKILAEGIDQYKENNGMLEHLVSCVDSLPDKERKILQVAYNSETKIKHFAEDLNLSSNALYQKLSRLRVSLADCVHLKLNAQKT